MASQRDKGPVCYAGLQAARRRRAKRRNRGRQVDKGQRGGRGRREESDPSTSGSYRNCDSRPTRDPIKSPRRALSIRRQRSRATVVTLRGRGRICQPDGRVVRSLKYRLLTYRGSAKAPPQLKSRLRRRRLQSGRSQMLVIEELIFRHSSVVGNTSRLGDK